MSPFHRFDSDGLRRYFVNTSWLMADKVLRLGLALIISLLIARTLGPAQFGMFQYAVSFAGVFGMLISLGIEPIIVRDIIRSPESAGKLLGTAMTMRAGVAISVVVMVICSAVLLVPDPQTRLIIWVVAIGFLFHPAHLIEQYFQAQISAKRSSPILMAAALGGAAWVAIGLSLQASAVFYSMQMLIESALIAIGLFFIFFRTTCGTVRFTFDRGTVRSLIIESWPLTASLALVGLYTNIDKLIINELLGNSAVGLYVAAAKLSEAWYFIPMVVVNSLFPAIIRARESSPEHYQRRLQNLYNLMAFMGVAVAIPVSLAADWIIVTLYGEAYREAGGVLQLHVWAGVLVFLGVASGRWYILEGHTRLYLGRTATGVVTLVASNLLLIPPLGIIGGAWSALLAQFIVVFVFDALWKESRGMFLMKLRSLSPLHWLAQR